MRNILLLAACCAMIACGCNKTEEEPTGTNAPQAERPNAPKQPGSAPNAGLNPNATGNPDNQVGSKLGGN